MTILVYLLKTTVVFVTLFSLYNVFLRNVTFLRLRRWYLNGMLILSFLVPWISLYLLPSYYHPEPGSILVWVEGSIRGFILTNWLTESWGNELVNIFVLSILGIVIVLVSVKYIFALTGLYKFLKTSQIVFKNKQYTLRTGCKGEGSFCFLKTIYLCSPSLNEQNINIILEHEKAHIRQKHYIDMWLSAMCDYFFWFYPFVKQFQTAWEEVLECLADREAIQVLQVAPITYQSVLYSNLEYSSLRPIFNNAFGRSMIAKRLLFISKKPNCFKRMLPGFFFSLATLCLLTVGLTFVDIQVFHLKKINEIRNAGYRLDEVTTGYVIDSKTQEPVTNVIVRGDDAVAVTDGDGFFFIEKSALELSVQHVAYNKKNATVSDDLIIMIEPSVYPISMMQSQTGRMVTTASFLSGKNSYNDYISQNMRYPEAALIRKINGTVWVKAEIDVRGKVKKVQLHQGISDDLNREAIRLVKNMPDWNPAIQNNERTKVQILLPVHFN